MKRLTASGVVVILMVMGFGIISTGASSEVPKFPLPLLVTCTGQTPGSITFYTILNKLRIEATHDPLIVPRKMKGYKTMVVVMGASLKGLGAAGLNQQEELERCNIVLEKAKELGIKIVGAHIGGEARRNTIADKFITPFAPQVDYLLVLAESNKDDLFTNIAEEHKIPLTVVESFADLLPVVTEMFQ